MNDALIHVVLVVLTLVAVAGSVAAWVRLRRRNEKRSMLWVHLATGIVLVGAGVIFISRWATHEAGWSPLVSHLDGLLLVTCLLAATLWYVQSRPRLTEMSVFGLPLLGLLTLWSLCASAWTYRPFEIDTLQPVWMFVHLSGVYVGTLVSAVAALCGAMYLNSERRLKMKQDLSPSDGPRGASLEKIEGLIQQSAALGFALLTLGMVSGVVVLSGEAAGLAPGWWHTPKVVVATVAWASFALVMNLKHATAFRGKRAAWLAIGGFVLLVVVYGIVTAGDGGVVEATVQRVDDTIRGFALLSPRLEGVSA